MPPSRMGWPDDQPLCIDPQLLVRDPAQELLQGTGAWTGTQVPQHVSRTPAHFVQTRNHGHVAYPTPPTRLFGEIETSGNLRHVPQHVAPPASSRIGHPHPEPTQFVFEHGFQQRRPVPVRREGVQSYQGPVTPRLTPIHQTRSEGGNGEDPETPLQRTASNRGRTRGRSSSGRRASQGAIIRQNAAGFRWTSPVRSTREVVLEQPFHWIQRHAYHAGDRFAGIRRQHDPTMTPTRQSRPRSRPASSSTSSQGRAPFYCEVEGCKERGKPWGTKSELEHHQRKHIPEGERPYACPLCGQGFLYPKDVFRHLTKTRVHDGECVKCPSCNKPMSRNDNLSRHIASQHPQTPSNASGSSYRSPASATGSSFSDGRHGQISPSTSLSSPMSMVQEASHCLQQTLQPFGGSDDPFVDTRRRRGPGPGPVPMARGHTN